MIRQVFQTLQDKETEPTKLEAEGPYLCDRSDAWLGNGYYFWESYIENAHWWGSEARIRDYNNRYIICQAEYTRENNKLFNITGDNPEHMRFFKAAYEKVKTTNAIANNESGPIKVSFVISYLIRNQLFDRFEAILCFEPNCKSRRSKYSEHVVFEEKWTKNRKNKITFSIDLYPPYQICFLKKKSLGLNNYRIVYPETYI